MEILCCFNGCTLAPMPGQAKCAFHKNRGICRIEACANQVYARGLCVRHGGRQRCFYHGCTTAARVGGYCSRHNGVTPKKHCTVEGCIKKANRHGRCVRHGGRRQCKIEGCVTHARSGGYCSRHAKAVDSGKSTKATLCTETESKHAFLALDVLDDLDFLLPVNAETPLRGDELDESILACLIQSNTWRLVMA